MHSLLVGTQNKIYLNGNDTILKEGQNILRNTACRDILTGDINSWEGTGRTRSG